MANQNQIENVEEEQVEEEKVEKVEGEEEEVEVNNEEEHKEEENIENLVPEEIPELEIVDADEQVEAHEVVLEEKPAHYNDDVYRDRICDDDELRYQMIQRPVQNEKALDLHLFNYCDDNLEKRYRTVIKENKILPLEAMKKTITLKLRKHSEKVRDEIRETIDETFQTYYPEKILTFINSTVKLLFLERIRDMDREFTCVHKGSYYHIKMICHYNKVKFGRSYHTVKIEITTSKFE